MQDPQPSGGPSHKVLMVVGSVVGVLALIGVVTGVLIAILGGNGPRGTATVYLQALASGDYSKVCQLSADSVQQQMTAAIQQPDAPTATCADYGMQAMADDGYYVTHYGESRASILQHMQNSMRITRSTTRGHRATVWFAWTATYDGDNRKFLDRVLHGDPTTQRTGAFDMVEQHGAWKVVVLRWDS